MQTRRLPRPAPLALACLIALGSPLTTLLSAPVMAQTASVVQAYNIPAGSLAETLNQLAATAGISLSFDPALAAGRQSAGLRGNYSTYEALAIVLRGSGLIWQEKTAGAISITAPEAADSGVVVTGVLDVSSNMAFSGNDGALSSAFDIYQESGAVHHIDREQLERVPYTRAGDILDNVPGVTASNSANGSGVQINIRGLQGHGRVRTLIDGAQQSLSTYRGYPGNRDDSYIDPDLIGSIDIRKGPDAGANSAGVTGGVVMLRTLSAKDLITEPEQNWGVRVRGMQGNNYRTGSACVEDTSFGTVTYCLDRAAGTGLQEGSMGTYLNEFGDAIPETNRSLSIAAAWRPLENWEITVARAERKSGNYASGSRGKESWRGLGLAVADHEVFNTSLDSETYLIKSKVGFFNDHSLEISYTDYENMAGYYNATTGLFLGPKRQYQLRKTTAKTTTINYIWRPDSRWWDVRANFWSSKVRGGEDLGAATFDAGGISIDNDIYGAELWNTSHLPVSQGSLTVKYGMSYSREETEFGGIGENTEGRYVNGRRITEGAFTQLNWQIMPWLALNGGVQHTKTKLHDLDTRIKYMRNGPEPDYNYTTTTPSFGIQLQPLDYLQVFANLTRGGRAPSLREAYMTDLAEPNPNLRPERQRNIEYGVSLALDNVLAKSDKLGMKLSRFNNVTKGYISRISFEALGADTNIPRSSRRTFGNLDRLELQGYELSLDYDSGQFFTTATIAYFDNVKVCYPDSVFNMDEFRTEWIPTTCYDKPNRDDWSANYIPPEFEYKATVGVRVIDQKLTLGAKARHATASNSGGSLWGMQVSDMVWDQYTVYDLFGNYKINRYADIALSVENMLDQFYLPSYTHALEALPAPGRTARITLTFSF